jgi:hypothetical protein
MSEAQNKTDNEQHSTTSLIDWSEHPLEHLSTVLRLYSKQTFSKDGVQWLRCVIKYAHDAHIFDSQTSQTADQLMLLLTEVVHK